MLHRFFSKRKNTIIQFSPIRSGSTLVYNILKEVFPEQTVTKAHKITEAQMTKAQLVCTYRNPVDSIYSSLLFQELAPDVSNIIVQIQHLKENGLVQLCELLTKRKDILTLRYEDFYLDHELIYNRLEAHFNFKIDDLKREELLLKYEVDAVKKNFTSKYSNAFEYDPNSHWHGNHISNFKGKPGAARTVLGEDQLSFIKTELKTYIQILGYSL
ncbi:MAG: hypothetical protein AAGA85_05215 [Bacteroidota bacterium]